MIIFIWSSMPKAGLKLKSKNDFTLKRGNVKNFRNNQLECEVEHLHPPLPIVMWWICTCTREKSQTLFPSCRVVYALRFSKIETHKKWQLWRFLHFSLLRVLWMTLHKTAPMWHVLIATQQLTILISFEEIFCIKSKLFSKTPSK